MIIGVIGLGFVGQALVDGINHLADKEIHIDFRVYDPKYTENVTIDMLDDSDIIFVCVPTPMGADGHIDDSIINSTLFNLERIGYKGIVCIKSTVLPTSIIKFKKTFKSLKIITNPEFLTERTAREDFINSEWIILGGENEDLKLIEGFYRDLFKNKAKIVKVSAEEAMMAKYMTNTLFAVKVSLMNEFYYLWNSINDNRDSWNNIIKAFSSDTRVGLTHLEVPGHDGQMGWGGKCWPKDLNALMALSKNNETVHNVMEAAWESNKIFRKDKNWLKIPGAVNEHYKDN